MCLLGYKFFYVTLQQTMHAYITMINFKCFICDPEMCATREFLKINKKKITSSWNIILFFYFYEMKYVKLFLHLSICIIILSTLIIANNLIIVVYMFRYIYENSVLFFIFFINFKRINWSFSENSTRWFIKCFHGEWRTIFKNILKIAYECIS